MSDEECKHGLDPRWCAACKAPLPRHEQVDIEATFAARYEGQCSGCNLPIQVGQVVHRLSTEQYVHRGCE